MTPAPVVARPGAHGIAKEIAAQPTLQAAALRLARGVQTLMRVDEVHCVWIDWPRRTTRTVGGPVEDVLEDLVLQVAGSGRPYVNGGDLVEPIGRAPARAALVMRNPTPYTPGELQMLATLAIGIAPAIDRLIALARVKTAA